MIVQLNLLIVYSTTYLPDGHGRILPRSDSSVNNLVLSYYEMERDDNFVAEDLSVSYSMGLGR